MRRDREPLRLFVEANSDLLEAPAEAAQAEARKPTAPAGGSELRRDAHTPAQIASLVEAAGVRKVGLPALKTLTLSTLAGAFIAFGAMLFILVVTESALGAGPTRLLGGLSFSLGLILVSLAGAELFTGNHLIVMGWAGRKVAVGDMLRNWTLVFFGNFVGSIAIVGLAAASGILTAGGGAYAETAAGIAAGKLALDFNEAFARGVLCNALVCLAVLLSFAGRSVGDKILGIVFPITAFVALGFEHSIANMFLIPFGQVAGGAFDTAGFVNNLVPVTLGNIVGGVIVGLGYWLCFLRNTEAPPRLWASMLPASSRLELKRELPAYALPRIGPLPKT